MTPQQMIGPELPPPLGIMGGSVHRYRRGLSPWHRDAFPDEFKDLAPEQQSSPTDGWMAEDWCGNYIGFIPDGTPWPNSAIDRTPKAEKNGGKTK